MKISPISLVSASVLLSAHVVLGGGNGASGGGDAEPIISLVEQDEASPTAKLSLRGGGGRALEYKPHLYFKGLTENVIGDGDHFGLCQGDCDVDSDCESGLRCFQRDGFDHVFGCTGGGSGDRADVDYCVWSDAKSDCPNGEEGYYCGNNEDVPSQGPHSDGDLSTIHLGDNVLYECERRYENGQWVAYWDKIDTCTNNDQHTVCQVNGGGHDQCVKPSESHPVCPNGRDGRYCGNSPYAPSQGPSKEYGALHLDDGVLYECNSGFWHKIDTCTNNHPYEICYVHGGGHDDCIEPHPAPGPPPPAPHPAPGPSPECPGNVNGQYCGNSPLVAHVTHLENGVLYNCDDGHYSYSIDCEDLVHKDYPPYFCHYTTDTHKYGTDTCKLMLPPVPPSPTAAPTAGPTTFCENSANENKCAATTSPSDPYPECVGTNGRGDRCKKGDNTAKCYKATERLLNTPNGSMETIMNHAKLFKYGVYCGDFNGCNKSEQCCAPPAPCDDKDDNGVDESCKEKKDCEAHADGDYFKRLQCEASFVQDLQHAYIDSLDKNGEPQVNGFCDEDWYEKEFDITLHQGTMKTTGAKFFTHESVLNAFSPCCSPYGVRQCLKDGGSKVAECTDDVLCFCKSIADQFAYLEGDYKTCSQSYKHIDDKCSNVHPDDVPFGLHYTSYSQ